jgi:uncharacterized protein (TIGR00369 family)
MSDDVSAAFRAFLENSPFTRDFDLELVSVAPDEVEMALPFNEGLATYGDVVHGGALSTFIDVAATAAAWSGADFEETARGATISLTVKFLQAARGGDLRAHARVLRRGRQICFCEVDVRTEDELVAKGLVTYKLG